MMNTDRERSYLSPLRLTRITLGLRQRDLAAILGVHCQRISDWELGLRQPTPEQIRRLTTALADLQRVTSDASKMDLLRPEGEA